MTADPVLQLPGFLPRPQCPLWERPAQRHHNLLTSVASPPDISSSWMSTWSQWLRLWSLMTCLPPSWSRALDWREQLELFSSDLSSSSPSSWGFSASWATTWDRWEIFFCLNFINIHSLSPYYLVILCWWLDWIDDWNLFWPLNVYKFVVVHE